MKAERVQASVLNYIRRENRERQCLRTTLGNIATKIPETVIFGGMLREFAWGKAKSFASDIDLVCLASREDIYRAIKAYEPRVNRFGGYRFISGQRSYDIWALEDTWALRQGLVSSNGFEALFDTTFFGVDAALFHLTTKKYRYSTRHACGIDKRCLDVNLIENPSPKNMAARAIRMAMNNDLSVSPDLAQYILMHATSRPNVWTVEVFLRALIKHVSEMPSEPFRFSPQSNVGQAR